MLNISLESLRFKHHRLIYNAYTITKKANHLSIKYHFYLEPDLHFSPETVIPLSSPFKLTPLIENLIFHLGLIELLSYWKTTCSPEILIKAGFLNARELAWWHDLYLHGLGEFFYRNQIDFTAPNFLTFQIDKEAPALKHADEHQGNGNLILVGGGKDSALTLDLLSEQNSNQNTLMVNPNPAAIRTAKIAGFNDPLIIQREIDPALLKLNAAGYLNGHTPFSAYLSFLSLLVARLHGFDQIITSNEASAGEASLTFHNLPINHQYSKSYRYEKLFREYAGAYLSPHLNYFSFLRPLTELQIAALFTKTHDYDQAFASCNVTRNIGWCGTCPKCAFVYLVLSAFMDKPRLESVFGKDDFFNHPEIIKHLKDLIGIGPHKPFDCVGTIQDSKDALILALARHNHPVLKKLANQLNLDPVTTPTIHAQIVKNWDHNHFLPPQLENILRTKLENL